MVVDNNDRRSPEMSDHDILIRHSVQLDNLCELIHGNDQRIDEFIKRIDLRCEVRQREIQSAKGDAMPITTFWKLTAILVVVLTAMVATMGANRTISIQNEIQIENNGKLIEQNSRLLNNLLKDIIPAVKNIDHIERNVQEEHQ